MALAWHSKRSRAKLLFSGSVTQGFTVPWQPANAISLARASFVRAVVRASFILAVAARWHAVRAFFWCPYLVLLKMLH